MEKTFSIETFFIKTRFGTDVLMGTFKLIHHLFLTFSLRFCLSAKPALIIICVIAGVIVLALLVAIVACSMHKKKSSGQTSFQNGN